MNTVDERKDELEALQAAQGAVRLEGDVITTNGSIISGHFGARGDRGGQGGGGGLGPGGTSMGTHVGGLDHRILSSLSLSDIASVCGQCGDCGVVRWSCWPRRTNRPKTSKPPHLRYNRHHTHHAHLSHHFGGGGGHVMKPGFITGNVAGAQSQHHQIRLKTFRMSTGSPQLSDIVVDDDEVLGDDEVTSGYRSRRRRRNMVLDDDEDESRETRPSRPRLDSDDHSYYDEEYYAPLPDDFCAPEVKRVSI